MFLSFTTTLLWAKVNERIKVELSHNSSLFTLPSLPYSLSLLTTHCIQTINQYRQNSQPDINSWAFSAIQALEAANAITNGQLYDLSEQQLVDCSGTTGNEGCNGGLMNNAYDYLISAGGSCQTKDYPYTGRDGQCKKCPPTVVVKGYDNAPSGNDGLAKTLQRGPVAVALAATSSFQFYSSGVFSDCSSTSLNHGVGLVGLLQARSSSDVTKDAWVIRNSWGASWGLNGHIYLDATNANCLGMSVTAAKWNVIPTV
jgi:C1A family cysteine protease